MPFTHLVEISPSSHDHNLGISGVAQVGCQLPLPGPIPADVEEDLDDNEYYDNSRNKQTRGEVIVATIFEAVSVYMSTYVL